MEPSLLHEEGMNWQSSRTRLRTPIEKPTPAIPLVNTLKLIRGRIEEEEEEEW
jgi:hypothetical protein